MSVKPFEGPKLKIARACQHMAELEAKAAAYLSGDSWAMLLERHKQTGKTSITLRGTEIPLELSSIFGDAMHNLRTALDLMANDLVSLSGVQPKNVYFPFGSDAAGFEDQLKAKMKGASGDILNMVRALKPYRGGNEPLRALHDLDIADKHVSVLGAGAAAATQSLPMRPIPSDRPNRLSFEAVFGALETVPINVPEFTRQADAANHVIVGKLVGSPVYLIIGKNLPFSGEPVIETSKKLAEMCERIVQSFEAHCLGSKKPAP